MSWPSSFELIPLHRRRRRTRMGGWAPSTSCCSWRTTRPTTAAPSSTPLWPSSPSRHVCRGVRPRIQPVCQSCLWHSTTQGGGSALGGTGSALWGSACSGMSSGVSQHESHCVSISLCLNLQVSPELTDEEFERAMAVFQVCTGPTMASWHHGIGPMLAIRCSLAEWLLRLCSVGDRHRPERHAGGGGDPVVLSQGVARGTC